MSDADLTEYYRFQAMHWKNLALIYHQQLMATRNRPERHYGKTTLHRDPTGNAAVNAVEKERKDRK